MYEKLLDVIHQTGAEIASCKLRMVYENSNNVFTDNDKNTIEVFENEVALDILISDYIRQVVWNKLYKSDIIKDIPFDVGKQHEDEFWSYKAIGKASQTALIDYTGYNYLQRQGSIMGNSYSLKRLDAIEAKCLRQEYLEKNFPSLKKSGLKDLIFSCVYQGQLALKYLSNDDKKTAIKKLKKVIKKYITGLKINDYSGIKEKIWLTLIKISFVLTCKLRNILRIGL